MNSRGGLLHDGRGHRIGKIDFQTVLDQDANDAQRGAAESERVPVAAGFLAEHEDAGQGVELVGNRQHATR